MDHNPIGTAFFLPTTSKDEAPDLYDVLHNGLIDNGVTYGDLVKELDIWVESRYHDTSPQQRERIKQKHAMAFTSMNMSWQAFCLAANLMGFCRITLAAK